ncbi:hypothetical protein DMC64_39150 [Amycolatopsis sp. WAC 04197]|nr:hypothetical protein DMC64_39150 [Amycolatopsis sp. WAC 04197]
MGRCESHFRNVEGCESGFRNTRCGEQRVVCGHSTACRRGDGTARASRESQLRTGRTTTTRD